MPRRKRKAELPDEFKRNIERVKSGEISPRGKKKSQQGKRSKKRG